MKRQASFRGYLLLYILIGIGANIAHPFTPKLFQNLAMPDYMFGLSFALMSFTSFFFSPSWGAKSDRSGRVKLFSFCLFGYAMGQLLFSQSTTILGISIARLISGTFSGGWCVTAIAYANDLSPAAQKGRNMSLFVAVQSLSMALGFFIGGLLADVSIAAAFQLQVGILSLSALLLFLLFRDTDDFTPQTGGKVGFQNPLAVFRQAGSLITPKLLVFFSIVLLASLASQAFDNSFNYFITVAYDFPPSANGKIKAAIGILALICNLTLNIWIVRHTNWYRSLWVLLGLSAMAMAAVTLLTRPTLFLVVSVGCFLLNSIYLPLIQSILSQQGNGKESGILAGLFYSCVSFGKVIGPLLAGILYGIGNRLPFLVTFGVFVLATLLAILRSRMEKAAK